MTKTILYCDKCKRILDLLEIRIGTPCHFGGCTGIIHYLIESTLPNRKAVNMEKYFTTISAPTGYTLDQATNFINEAIRAENLVRDDGVLILVDSVVESQYNKSPTFSAGRYDTLIRKIVLDLKNYGLQTYLSNLIYSVFQFYDEEKITDKDLSTIHDTKQGKIFSILTDAYIQIKTLLHKT